MYSPPLSFRSTITTGIFAFWSASSAAGAASIQAALRITPSTFLAMRSSTSEVNLSIFPSALVTSTWTLE